MKSITLLPTTAGLLAALLLTQIGCTQSAQESVADNPALTSPVPDGMVRGTVLETLNAGGYTYVFIETDQDQRWVAVPKTAVLVDDVVLTQQGMAMPNFESKSLNRTFERVYFAGGLQNLTAPTLPAGQQEAALPSGYSTTEDTHAEVPLGSKVAEFKPGQNIAYLYANRDVLTGQKISLRGEVVKFNSNILGTNFIHIQDGSGDVADGSNDLAVTSKAVTTVGETVVVTGTVIQNKDFGYGYKFPVLLGNASISSE